MRRIGFYDAIDKWELLCRYWQDRDSALLVGTDRFKIPLVPKWHDAAVAGGRRFGFEYLAARLTAPRPPTPAESRAGVAAIGDAIAAAEGAGKRPQVAYASLVDAITTSGFQTPFDGGLPPAMTTRLREIFKQGAIEALQWTEDDGEVPNLALVRALAPAFPAAVLRHKSSALCLFSCRFCGKADVIHVHDARIAEVTLVDNDASAMADMKLIYPASWNYIVADYKDFLAAAAQTGARYDLVIADEWLYMAKEVAWDALPMIMSVCSDTLLLNYTDEMFAELGVPPGDLSGLSNAVSRRTNTPIVFADIIPRSKPASWVVIRKPAD